MPRSRRPNRIASRAAGAAVLAAAASALAAAPASAFFEPFSRSGDLDGDPGVETVRTALSSFHGQRGTQVRVQDTCADGAELDQPISGTQESLARLNLVEADPEPGREVFLELRSGASGRAGEARVVAWRAPVEEGDCPDPRTLFRYSTPRSSSRPPRGALPGASSFAVKVRDVETALPGREIVLDEYFLGRRVPAACCPEFRKRRWLYYEPGVERYVAYDVAVKRLRVR